MSRPGYVDKRGSWRDRQRRRAWLLETFDPDLGPTLARCALQLANACEQTVDADTLTVDRKQPGGTYRRDNIQPACKPCQDRQGYLLGSGGTLIEWALTSYRDARHAWERRFEEETGQTYARGLLRREQAAARRGGRRPVTDFVEAHPPPTLRAWLESCAQAAQDHAHGAGDPLAG